MYNFSVGPPDHFTSPGSKHETDVATSHSAKYGKIQLIVGPMFSGKSTELLRKMRIFEIAKHKTLVVKYAKDDRYSDAKLSTHDKQMRTAVKAHMLSEIEDLAMETSVIGIDEGQFFDDIFEFSNRMANLGKIVIVAALDGTFEQKPFANIMKLVPCSESIVKLTAVCMTCYRQAAFTRRIDASDKRVEVIGNENMYAAACRRCLLLDQETYVAYLNHNSQTMAKDNSIIDPQGDVGSNSLSTGHVLTNGQLLVSKKLEF